MRTIPIFGLSRIRLIADDLTILCRSKASAEQALAHIAPYIEKQLFLRINEEKTSAAHVTKIKFLGFGFYNSKKGEYRPTVHAQTKRALKDKIRALTSRRRLMEREDWQRRL